ncbi:tripartite-type tricarboxylate transporter receptor subunit TctC [Pseudacidovorax sp. 1753]|uniref:Bug family tripartite tricarboxylate transporter substrate binding protein n=1 Tax=Pseudacidovorax sp. 1753 TaxID=3156419 RepID=UPI003391457F
MMRIARRSLLGLALASTTAALGLAGSLPAAAEASPAYPDPNRPIRMVVPYPAGGATDVLARLVAQKLGEAWKVPVVVDNRPGASGTLGTQLVARAAPDGHTVLFSIVALVQQIPLMNLPYDPLKDFVPVTRVALSPSILAVPRSTPASNVREFVELVKAQPGKYSYGSYGAGSSSHIQGSLLNLQGGLDMVHVPYQGGAPLVNAMMGGQLSAAFVDAGSSRPHLPKFKLLGITGTQRVSWLPDVPTFKEQGLTGFEPLGWFGMLMPAGTPQPVVQKFSAESLRILALPDVREKIEALGLVPAGDTPAEFAAVLRSDAAAYAAIIRDAQIRLN